MIRFIENRLFRKCPSPPSASSTCIPADRRALRGDKAQSLLVLPLDAGIWYPGQYQSGAKAFVLLHMYAQITCRRQCRAER